MQQIRSIYDAHILTLPHRHLQSANQFSILLPPRPVPGTTLELYAALHSMKVKIQKWHGVATWRWDLPEDDVCGICQNQFDGTCPTCKYPGDECSLCKPKRLIEPPMI